MPCQWHFFRRILPNVFAGLRFFPPPATSNRFSSIRLSGNTVTTRSLLFPRVLRICLQRPLVSSRLEVAMHAVAADSKKHIEFFGRFLRLTSSIYATQRRARNTSLRVPPRVRKDHAQKMISLTDLPGF